MAEGHHRQGIAHQHKIHTGRLGPAGAEGIPGGEHSNRLALLLALPQLLAELAGREAQDISRGEPLLTSGRLGPMRLRRLNLVRSGRQQPHGMLEAGVDSGSPLHNLSSGLSPDRGFGGSAGRQECAHRSR